MFAHVAAERGPLAGLSAVYSVSIPEFSYTQSGVFVHLRPEAA